MSQPVPPKHTVLWATKPRATITGWGRTAFAVGWFWAGFVYEHKSAGNTWRVVNIIGTIDLCRSFRIEKQHAYYDGPNCGLALGWLRFFWSGNPWTGECKKCMPDEDEDV